MNKVNLNSYISINNVSNSKSTPRDNNSFKSIIDKKTSEIKFSKHALERIKLRDLSISESEYNMLINAINKADSKGIKDTLILLGNKVFVVNLKNRVVITAMDGRALKDNVITNIDGAVIV
ncbi:TIGR02530 family flagellar biosynthesis protein [Thermoanaerobacterium sp. RBIITD]|uniref:TIGR02530 family flagellar biosynthesis protein n=1 Tax=Thermoanaerobacterium sp. RBIITD TaxID=1550240 RepID=UPI000BB7C1E8|nr:TIGR02530 family flagellar biosynthesis protein [Thermoanaerobacterium sp. RBIITD]SNX55515.1 flagellar operon protein [Thermoanaerobacterium sp. RBIITD]